MQKMAFEETFFICYGTKFEKFYFSISVRMECYTFMYALCNNNRGKNERNNMPCYKFFSK